tara:strand:+ start:35875 stop:36750 length:876 start_codon:yes stop_codon:yes gene_type:complete
MSSKSSRKVTRKPKKSKKKKSKKRGRSSRMPRIVRSVLRQSSVPGTQEESKTSGKICFNEGDLAMFYFTHRNLARFTTMSEGIHLGMLATLHPGTSQQHQRTLGFYPRQIGTGLFRPVDGAIKIPDDSVQYCIEHPETCTILNVNNEPIIISAEQAQRLNKYTCTEETVEESTFSLEEGKREIIPSNLTYKLQRVLGRNCTDSTNCQGFLVEIFHDNQRFMREILPKLNPLGSKQVSTLQPRRPIKRNVAKKLFRKMATPLIGFLGGKKKTKKKRKKKKRRKKRKSKHRFK